MAFGYGGDLWVSRLDGSDVRRLTTADGDEQDPAFSPDGTLSARPAALRWLVLVDTLGVVVVGLGADVALLLPTLGVRGTQVYGLSPRDPGTLAMASALLLVGGAIAGFVPAWRASRIDPVTALRAD